jgi:hypothetical protein
MRGTGPTYHELKGSKKAHYPKRCLFFDCETTQEKLNNIETLHHYWFACTQFIDYTNKKPLEENTFMNEGDLWNYIVSLTRKNKPLHVFAHNAAFDFRVSKGFTNLNNRGFYINDLCIDQGRFILHAGDRQGKRNQRLKVFKKLKNPSQRRIIFLDTLNWFKMSLEALGEGIGINKLPFPGYDKPFDVWETYCKQDVEVCRQAVEYFIQFLKDNNLGGFAPTIASQAFKAWKSVYLKHKVVIHTEKAVRKLERESYCGGRVEAFYIGQPHCRKVYCLDVNSMYPYVMKINNYPSVFKCLVNCPTPKEMERYTKKYLYVARVRVDCQAPIVPFKSPDGLIFKRGETLTTLCQPEIEYILENGGTVDYLNVCFYEYAKIFEEYVTKFHEMRQEYKRQGNQPYYINAKYLLNTCYGKLGQLNRVWEWVGREDFPITYFSSYENAEGDIPINIRCINGEIFQSDKKVEGFDSFPAIASFVTSYARVYLDRLMVQAGRENVFYCDTDSLFTNLQGYKNLSHHCDEYELGALKLEKTTTRLKIRGPKDYLFGNTKKIKGVGKKHKARFGSQYITEQWEGLVGSLHSDNAERVIVRKVTKTLKRQYKKGVVKEDGFVEPFFEPMELNTKKRVG